MKATDLTLHVAMHSFKIYCLTYSFLYIACGHALLQDILFNLFLLTLRVAMHSFKIYCLTYSFFSDCHGLLRKKNSTTNHNLHIVTAHSYILSMVTVISSSTCHARHFVHVFAVRYTVDFHSDVYNDSGCMNEIVTACNFKAYNKLLHCLWA